jgi:hypothetical protein
LHTKKVKPDVHVISPAVIAALLLLQLRLADRATAAVTLEAHYQVGCCTKT